MAFLDNNTATEKMNDLQNCILAKVKTSKLINIEAFRSVMKDVWNMHKNTVTDYIGDNLFMRFMNPIELRKNC